MRTRPDTALECACWGPVCGGGLCVAGMNAETWGHRPSPRKRTAVRVSSGPASPSLPHQEAEGGSLPAMPGMQLQQGWQGDKAACCPEGGWKGAAGVDGASLLASSSPQGPLVLGGVGPGGTDLFPRQFPLGSGNLLIRGRGEAQTGWGCGVRGAPRGQRLCVSSSAHHPTGAEAIVRSNAHPSPSTPLQGSFLSQGGGTGFQPARNGRREENSLSCFGGLVASPWAQTPGLLFLEARMLPVAAFDEPL